MSELREQFKKETGCKWRGLGDELDADHDRGIDELYTQWLESKLEHSCEGCNWFRFPACDYPDACSRMETDYYEPEE